MRKVIVLLVVFAFAAGLLLISDDAAFARRKDKDKEEAKAEETVAAPAQQAPQGTVVCKFKNDAEMTEFEQLYIAKQATFGRIGVLQAYFAMEQANLTEIDKQLEEKFGFKMDPTKMYDLNRDTKEIRDLGPIPTPPAATE